MKNEQLGTMPETNEQLGTIPRTNEQLGTIPLKKSSPPKKSILYAKFYCGISKRIGYSNFYQVQKKGDGGACMQLKHYLNGNSLRISLIYKNIVVHIPKNQLMTMMLYCFLLRPMDISTPDDERFELYVPNPKTIEDIVEQLSLLRKMFVKKGKMWHFVGKINPTHTDIRKTNTKYLIQERIQKQRTAAKARGEFVPFR